MLSLSSVSKKHGVIHASRYEEGWCKSKDHTDQACGGWEALSGEPGQGTCAFTVSCFLSLFVEEYLGTCCVKRSHLKLYHLPAGFLTV